jgi:hypothetical protein
MRLEELGQLKNPMTSLGNEQLRYRLSPPKSLCLRTPVIFQNMLFLISSGCHILTQPPKLEDHPLSLVQHCLLSTFTVLLPLYLEIVPSVRKRGTGHVTVTYKGPSQHGGLKYYDIHLLLQNSYDHI